MPKYSLIAVYWLSLEQNQYFQLVYEKAPSEEICSDRTSWERQIYIRFQAWRSSRYSALPSGQAYVRTEWEEKRQAAIHRNSNIELYLERVVKLLIA